MDILNNSQTITEYLSSADTVKEVVKKCRIIKEAIDNQKKTVDIWTTGILSCGTAVSASGTLLVAANIPYSIGLTFAGVVAAFIGFTVSICCKYYQDEIHTKAIEKLETECANLDKKWNACKVKGEINIENQFVPLSDDVTCWLDGKVPNILELIFQNLLERRKYLVNQDCETGNNEQTENNIEPEDDVVNQEPDEAIPLIDARLALRTGADHASIPMEISNRRLPAQAEQNGGSTIIQDKSQLLRKANNMEVRYWCPTHKQWHPNPYYLHEYQKYY